MSKLNLRLRWAATLGLGLLACGCITIPDHPPLREPDKTAPEDFGPFQRPSVESSNGVEPTAPSMAEQPWSEFFGESQLRDLIDDALASNKELNIRSQEILIAQSEVLARSGEYLPSVDVGVGAGLEKVGEITSQGVSDEVNGVPENLPDFRLGLRASWEVDIWKRLRNATKAAAQRYLGSIEGRNFLVTQLVAEIANSYYELLALDSQLAVLKRNIAIQQDALDVVRLEKKGARVTELAVQRFEAEVLKNQSRQYELEQRALETQNRINLLIGRYPQPIPRDADSFNAPLPSFVGVGLPTELLANRPDVKQAELELSAAKLDVASAKARFYPALRVDAQLGFESWKGAHLFDSPGSLFYGLAGDLVAPLLNRRGIKAEFFARIAEQVKASFTYEQTLLRAFVEVANQLSMIGNLEKSYELQSRQVELLNASIEVSGTLFRSARADYMEVLLTRRDALEAEMELIETRLRQKRALVDVYRAVGGGWR